MDRRFNLGTTHVTALPLDYLDSRPEALRYWMATIVRNARSAFMAQHVVLPSLMYLRPNLERPGAGYHQVLVDMQPHFRNPNTRSLLAANLPQAMLQERAICALFMTEMWMYQDSPDRVLQTRRQYRDIGDLPDTLRQQAIWFRFETPTRAWSKYLVFRRHAGTRPRILTTENAIDGFGYTGAFMEVSHFLYQPLSLWTEH